MNKISIIGGTGKMGTLVGNILTEAGFNICVINKETKDRDDLIKNSDTILFIVPISSFLENLESFDTTILKNKLLVDFSSCVLGNVKELSKYSDRVGYIHLLFGPDVTSLKNQNIVVSKNLEDDSFNSLVKTFSDLEANIFRSTPEDHDKMMALTQALSQFSSISLAKTISDMEISRKDLDNFSTITSSLNFSVIKRIVSQDAGLWSAIQFENPLFREVLEKHVGNIDSMSKIVEEKDVKGFREMFVGVQDFWKDGKTNIAEEEIVEKIPDNALGVLGPEGTYSSDAARMYDKRLDHAYFGSINAVIDALEKGVVKKAVLPFENSIHGTVTETLDGIYYKNLKIVDDLVLDINHSLVGVSNNVGEVKYIYSHPQALGQCKQYLDEHFPDAKRIQTPSTAGAIKKVKDEGSTESLAIGSVSSAKRYGLEIIEEKIQDVDNNQTLFVVVSKEEEKNDLPYTVFVIDPKEDRSGLLFDILKIFKDENINLSKIESRPDRDKLGSYIFYIKADIKSDDERFFRLFDSLSKDNTIKLLTN